MDAFLIFDSRQGPGCGGLEQEGHLRKPNTVALIFARYFVEAIRRSSQPMRRIVRYELLEYVARGETLRDAALHRGVLDAGKPVNELPELAGDGMHRERYDFVVAGWNGDLEDTGELIDFLELRRNAVPLVWHQAVADRLEIGHDIGAILGR